MILARFFGKFGRLWCSLRALGDIGDPFLLFNVVNKLLVVLFERFILLLWLTKGAECIADPLVHSFDLL